jgi:hypothetical protein
MGCAPTHRIFIPTVYMIILMFRFKTNHLTISTLNNLLNLCKFISIILNLMQNLRFYNLDERNGQCLSVIWTRILVFTVCWWESLMG